MGSYAHTPAAPTAITHSRLAELARSPTTDGLARSDWRDSGSANAIDATRDRDRGHEEAGTNDRALASVLMKVKAEFQVFFNAQLSRTN